jgi:hypothetical protein
MSAPSVTCIHRRSSLAAARQNVVANTRIGTPIHTAAEPIPAMVKAIAKANVSAALNTDTDM